MKISFPAHFMVTAGMYLPRSSHHAKFQDKMNILQLQRRENKKQKQKKKNCSGKLGKAQEVQRKPPPIILDICDDHQFAELGYPTLRMSIK